MVPVLLAIAPFVALVLVQGAEQRGVAAHQARAEVRRLVRLLAADHEQFLADAQQLLFVLANVPAVQAADGEASSGLFREVLTRYPQYSNLWLASPPGEVQASAYPVDLPLDPEDMSLLESAAAAGGFHQGPLRITRRRVPIMALAQTVGSPGRAVLLATIELQWLGREAATADLPNGSAVTVWDAAGRILVRYPEPERWVGRHQPDSEVLEAILASTGDGSAEASGIDGVERLYGFARITGRADGGTVFLAIGVPTAHAFAAAERTQRRNLIVLSVVALAAVGVAWIAGERLVAKLVDRLQHLAEVDPLTSLANRRRFDAAASRELRRARRFQRPLALVLLDIDRFKAVNDRHGHVAGDAVLREVARRLRAAARETDLVARYGGEEFAALLLESDHVTARQAAERMRGAVGDSPVVLGTEQIFVTISAGVTMAGDGKSLVECMEAADDALYRAKENGRNRVESTGAA